MRKYPPLFLFLVGVLAAIVLWSCRAHSQTTPYLNPKIQLFNGGVPCSGCLLYSYGAGTTNLKATYQDSAGVSPNANPTVLDSSGAATVYLSTSGGGYKLVLTTAVGVTIWSQDNVPVAGGGGGSYVLPALTASVLGGVKGTGSSLLCASGFFADGFQADGTLDCKAGSSGTITALGASTLGGVMGTGSSTHCPSGQLASGFSTAGALQCQTVSGVVVGGGGGPAATSPVFSFGMHALHYTDGFWTAPPPPWPSDSVAANNNTPIPFDLARTWNNTSCHWRTLEPSRGTYNWTGCDAWIQKAIASGQKVMWTFGYFPVWAESTGCANAYPNGTSPQNCPIAVEQDLKDFFTALVGHYQGQIAYYEGLNEANEQNYWYNPTDWTKLNLMQSDLFTIVHANDSNAKVICPASSWSSFGGSWSPQSYVQAEITNGMFAYCDGAAFHSETNNNPENSMATNVAVVSTVTSSAYPSYPVWDTEANWNGDATTLPATGDARGQFVARYLMMSILNGIRGVMWYHYEGDTEAGTTGWGPLWNSSGVLPAGKVYAQIYNWITGATISGFSTTPTLTPSQWGSTAALYCFNLTRTGGYSATACWYDGGTGNNLGSNVTTSYTPPGGTVQYRDMYGNVHTYTSGTIAVGNTPLIFENMTSYPVTSSSTAVFGNTIVKTLNNIFFADQYGGFTGAAIQAVMTAACTAFPGGARVVLSPGTYVLANQAGQLLLESCPLIVEGAGPLSTVLQAPTGVSSAVPVVRVQLGAAPNDNHIQFRNFSIASAGSVTAGDGLLFDNTNDAGGGPVTVEIGPHFVISSGQLNGYAVNTSSPNGGAAQLMWSLHDNVFGGGIAFDALADSAEILHNNFGTPSSSTHACITLTAASGAARQAIRDNNGSCAGGVLVVHRASQLMFSGNQFEQTFASTETNAAMVDLICDTGACADIQLWGNNLNSHNNATNNIRVGNAANTHIEDNTMTVESTSGVGINITASASGTRFPYNTYNLPAPAGTIYTNTSATTVLAAQAPNGSKAIPAYGFVNAPTHGLYYRSGSIEMALAGAATTQWNGSANVFGVPLMFANGQVDTVLPDSCVSRGASNTLQIGYTSGTCDASGTIQTTNINLSGQSGYLKIKDQGSCTMAAGTCSSQGLGHTYAAAPNCIATWNGSGTLTGFLKVPSTTTTVTPASSVNTDTAVVNYACFGN